MMIAGTIPGMAFVYSWFPNYYLVIMFRNKVPRLGLKMGDQSTEATLCDQSHDVSILLLANRTVPSRRVPPGSSRSILVLLLSSAW